MPNPSQENRIFACLDASHTDKCKAHERPSVDGKEFDPKAYSKQLMEANLITRPDALKNAGKKGGQLAQPGFKPQGTPKQKGGKLVYPIEDQHFG